MKEQQKLINLCKERVNGENLSIILSEILNIDRAAAYRRIRLETPFSISEISTLCRHFSISFDRILATDNSKAVFDFQLLYKDKNILRYLQNICSTLSVMSKSADSHLTFVAMDLPFFRQIAFPHTRRFMLFYWQKTVLRLEDFKSMRLEDYEVSEELNQVLEEISQLYFSISSCEVWSAVTLTSTISRVKYYWESGYFLSDDTFEEICNDLVQLLKNLKDESAFGIKTYTNINGTRKSTFELYQSEVYLSNNIFQILFSGQPYTYISYNSFNSMRTENTEINNECKQWIEHIQSNSIPLSKVSQKYRIKFFDDLLLQVDSLRNKDVQLD